jgi:hypothetical protein
MSGVTTLRRLVVSEFGEMHSKKCEAATSESNPGNANLPIGDGAEAQNANREIGVPRVRQPTPELKFKLGHYPSSPFPGKWELNFSSL